MNEILGSSIARLRREAGLTQEQLANILGISYQAVSKWETGNSCPDISTLPLLADLFGVSIDELFGRAPVREVPAPLPAPSGVQLPWPEDENCLYAVLFSGHRLIGSSDVKDLAPAREIRFEYEGPALNVSSAFTVNCDAVQGNVVAGASVNCDAVYGSVEASGSVTCDDVACDVKAGGNVTCDDVVGNVSAGGNVTCDSIEGDVRAGGLVLSDDEDDDPPSGQARKKPGFHFRINL